MAVAEALAAVEDLAVAEVLVLVVAEAFSVVAVAAVVLVLVAVVVSVLVAVVVSVLVVSALAFGFKKTCILPKCVSLRAYGRDTAFVKIESIPSLRELSNSTRVSFEGAFAFHKSYGTNKTT
ncbi:hypothetical protein [Neobacillus piezotolerans]|uniref:hypothetical protein n=1 Tax=Neobacillus piezotolerans TaxID=2259171 RepID=UPI0015F165E1|nr:hypothetical protein [Neobacillus piezotolerans]